MKLRTLVLLALSIFASATAHAAQHRLEAWGQGVSEFEAVKSAYKQIIGKALKLSVDGAGSMEGSLRRSFVRDVEEDLLRVQSTFFPGATTPRCHEDRQRIECQVVVQVQMDEFDAHVRSLLGQTGSAGGVVRDLRIGMVSKEDDTAARDLAAYLHGRLESDFGHDVFFSENFVDVDTLRSGCGEYERLAKSYEARGDNYIKTARKMRSSYSACKDLSDRDLIIVVDGAETRMGAFDGRAGGMPGEITLRLKLVQTKSSRSLPAPRPQSIKQFGYGNDTDFARSNLRDRLYEAAANYVAQQMNETLVNFVNDGRAPAALAERDYQVLISGANSDTPEGRAQLKLVRDWFANSGGYVLDANFATGNFGEVAYKIRASRPPDWTTISDKLYAVLDQAKAYARIDIDRSQNLTIAFQPNDALKAKASVQTIVEAKRAQRRMSVDERSMEVRRRDPETGTAVTVNEAVLRLRNKTKNDLLIVVNPVWIGQDGSSLPATYSYRQIVRLPAKTSERFTFMAPSKFAGPVTIELSCAGESCEVK